VVGAVLAFVANHFLWPSWEFLNVRIHLEKAIKANQIYLQEIATFIIKKEVFRLPTVWRARMPLLK
jgi:uncharacterized membrane protein YccC